MENSRREKVFISGKRSHERRGYFPENYARFCVEAIERGQIVVCAMHPKAREVFDSLGMSYLMIYPNENERDRYFTIYDNSS